MKKEFGRSRESHAFRVGGAYFVSPVNQSDTNQSGVSASSRMRHPTQIEQEIEKMCEFEREGWQTGQKSGGKK